MTWKSAMMISKRQVVRLLAATLETFRAEDEAVLKAGLGGAYVTVDDTGARHAGKSGYTTQLGSDTFTVFRTGPSQPQRPRRPRHHARTGQDLHETQAVILRLLR